MMLAGGVAFSDLFSHEGLARLDASFVAELAKANAALHNDLMAARATPEALENKAHSELLIALAPEVELFIAKLFGIEQQVQALAAKHHALAPLFACKRLFVQRRAAKAITPEQASAVNDAQLQKRMAELLGDAWSELEFASAVMGWLADEATHTQALSSAQAYAAWALYTDAGREKHGQGVLFKQPHKYDGSALVPAETEVRDGVTVLKFPTSRLRAREGFALTDGGANLSQALDQANYCIFCHHQGRDSCSAGMWEKDGSVKKNASDVPLAGCPLGEKISEMNELKAAGHALGALAVVVVDNPMCAGTGHRICNDCMKSCIYQKQEPVNIPQAETRTLTDVLALPYGFEIYALLTRWNPLNIVRPIPKPATHKKVLVAGAGPAGYTLAHHLLNDGHTVVMVDGLKIEPLPEMLTTLTPIQDIRSLWEALDTRTMAGFGGVAEYGITVRWDKNYLKVIRLLLQRRAAFALYGGVRFGSSITYDKAWQLGFDHIALCLGAGKPTVLGIPNGMARGVRTASDFLMGLQLTGAARKDSIANLQLRLPAVVIGGGLTAIDAATEALAYYPVQVEKFLSRYEQLIHERGEQAVRANWSEEDSIIAEEFIAHAKQIRTERQAAAANNRAPDLFALLDSWGGVKLIYRKRMIDAPSYRLNHEEVEKAFEEGIFFAESWEPQEVVVDGFGAASAIVLKQSGGSERVTLPTRTVLVAAGTSPNTVLAREDAAHFSVHGKYFAAVDEDGNAVVPEKVAKPKTTHVLMSFTPEGRAVSFFGDLHPSFAGNVVKAMGSAKQGYPVVSRALTKISEQGDSDTFLQRIKSQLTARVHAVNRLTSTIVEVVLHAPLAAEAFEPGQFYRLQNFEAHALRTETTVLAMEGLAMTGAWVDKENGLVSVIALEMGGSSDLCAHLAEGEPVVLMGPTGAPTEIECDETVLLAGGGLGNAVLFSIGRAFRNAGSKVLYFAGYKKAEDRYKLDEIEAAADVVVWCCDEMLPVPRRKQDLAYHGNIVQAMLAYASGQLSADHWPLSSVNRIIAIGSDRMMEAVAKARHGALKPYLQKNHTALGSINSPMQCMMKEICAQCLQQHKNPLTGEISYVYSCFNQDQPLDFVSFPHLAERLTQNALSEKLTAQWVDRCLRQLRRRA